MFTFSIQLIYTSENHQGKKSTSTFLWAKKLNKNEITNHYESVIKDILSTQTPNPAHFSTPTITKKETSILKHSLPKISLK